MSESKYRPEVALVTVQKNPDLAHEKNELLTEILVDIRELGLALARTTDAEDAKKSLQSVMALIRTAADRIPVTESINVPSWIAIYKEFQKLIAIKKQSSADIGQIFERIFDEHRDFIEDDLAQFAIEELKQTGKRFDLQDIIVQLYGYSKEEFFRIKDKNPEQVVEEMKKMKDAPQITLEMIQKLHATNNRGIIARSTSILRSDPDDISSFGYGRVGILAEDVKTEVDAVIAQANKLISETSENQPGMLARIKYELCAAKLHNDLLDIHPFLDRNGSTSLLFLELLMARIGYKPSPKRDQNYYNHLRLTLNNNIAAIALVASEMFRIKFVPGYYQGITTRSPEKQVLYEANLKRKRKMNEGQ